MPENVAEARRRVRAPLTGLYGGDVRPEVPPAIASLAGHVVALRS